MSFDAIFINAIKTELASYLPLKINKIQEVGSYDYLLNVHSIKKGGKLLLSANSQYQRIHFTNKAYTTNYQPSNFLMLFRKYFDGGKIIEINQPNFDRILEFKVEVYDDLKDRYVRTFYLELMGKYTNLVLVDDQNKIIDALKRVAPFTSTRTIWPGAQFTFLANEGRLNPFNSDYQAGNINEVYSGFNKYLANEVQYLIDNNQAFKAIMNKLETSNNLVITKANNKEYVHLIPLTYLSDDYQTYPLMEGLDLMYNEIEEKQRIKEQTGDLYKIVGRELKKYYKKLPKLEATLAKALNGDIYKTYGELLFSYQYLVKPHSKSVELNDFETGELVVIELDPKLNVVGNGNKYFSLYHKSKKAIVEMEKQIELCKEHITYLESINTQLAYASFEDANEIAQELVDLKLIAPTTNRFRKAKIKKVPNFLKLEIDGTLVYVGKNNLQNDYLTWEVARKNCTWLHAKDLHGSHVIVFDSEPNEYLLRAAAMLASYYSKGRLSSSVPVNYTSMKNVKKPKNRVLGLVYLQNYKTIYIDPSEEEVNNLIEKYQIK